MQKVGIIDAVMRGFMELLMYFKKKDKCKLNMFKKKYIIKKGVCRQCHVCPVECIAGAITKQSKGLPVIAQERCVSCGQCVSQCPFRAIQECRRFNF